MVQGRPAVLVRYSLSTEAEAPIELTLRPLTPFREADALTIKNDALREAVDMTESGIRCQPYDSLPALTISLRGSGTAATPFTSEPRWYTGVRYDLDLARGFGGHEDLFSPGRFEVRLAPGESVTVAATIDGTIDDPAAQFEQQAEQRLAVLPAVLDFVGRTSLAADDFLYRSPGGRLGVLAGFPWFGEWGRDTFIALPGLTLARGRLDQCAEVLSGALPLLVDGLLPNIYGADRESSHYGSVDASLWFARAVLLYDRAGGSTRRIRREYLPALIQIAEAYKAGTAPAIEALGISGDESELIRAGTPALNPTWMDANAGGRAVTPRHGYAVEICALWCSLLSYIAELSPPGATRAAWKSRARRAGRSFRDRFWLEEEGILADVWRPDGVDKSVRPNMVLAIALEFCPLGKARRARVLACAERDLLTPVGLRTLAADQAGYAPHYAGGPEARDGAYHQGTVWPWLLGFYCEASLRVSKTKANRAQLRSLWDELALELDRGGLGHIAEVYDAEAPREQGGTFAQAWNSAEARRALALIDGTLPLQGERK